MNDHPPELSADGKLNAYIFLCKDVTGQQQYYAVCLNKIEKRKLGALPVIYSDCSVAISKKRCPALKMREQELKEGKAMFFIPRKLYKGVASLVDKAKEALAAVVQESSASTNNGQTEKMNSPDDAMAIALSRRAARESKQ